MSTDIQFHFLSYLLTVSIIWAKNKVGEIEMSTLAVFQEAQEEVPLALEYLKKIPHLSQNPLHICWLCMLESPDWLNKSHGALYFGTFLAMPPILILNHKYLNFEYLFLVILSADLYLLEAALLAVYCLHLFQCSMAC